MRNQAAYALITGASRGLGKCFARALAAGKRNVVLVARSSDLLEALANELMASYGVAAHTVAMDLGAAAAGERLATEVRDRDLSVDLLVNNAGFGVRGEFWELPFERQSEMLRLHHTGLAELTYHLLPPMIARRRGGIINVASTAAFQPIPYAALYAATKSFVASFSMALAEELRPYGIQVVTLCPGRFRREQAGQNGAGTKGRFSMFEQDRDEVVVSALRALERGGGMVVPGGINQFASFAERLLPRGIVPRLVARLSRPKPAV